MALTFVAIVTYNNPCHKSSKNVMVNQNKTKNGKSHSGWSMLAWWMPWPRDQKGMRMTNKCQWNHIKNTHLFCCFHWTCANCLQVSYTLKLLKNSICFSCCITTTTCCAVLNNEFYVLCQFSDLSTTYLVLIVKCN